eukprot:419261-Amphidinium_carterae.1
MMHQSKMWHKTEQHMVRLMLGYRMQNAWSKLKSFPGSPLDVKLGVTVGLACDRAVGNQSQRKKLK